MSELRFAVVGAGFWARFQLAAWREQPGIRCVALHDRVRAKAEQTAQQFAIPAVYDCLDELIREERPDFVDVITDVFSHAELVRLAATNGVPVICQKPMAPTMAEAEAIVVACRQAGVPFLIHENWRWQTPIRAVKRVLDDGRIGSPFRARIDVISGFPVFENQPALQELEQFIVADMGCHILDVARFLFGEPTSVYCATHRVNADIRGEDVATVVMQTGAAGTTVICELAYAQNALEHECFPQTLLFVEGARGSLELAPDYWLRVTTADGTHSVRHPPPRYSWANPEYAVVHSSMVPCQADLLRAIRAKDASVAETNAADNLKTLRLVFAAYESAKYGRVVALGG